MDLEPTEEQQHAVDLARSGTSFAVEALAGTGKTTAVEMMASANRKRSHYLVFNRAMADEAKRKMPPHVRVSTAHSLAFREVGKKYSHRLNGQRMKSWEIAKRLGIEAEVVKTRFGSKRLSPAFLAGMVTRTVRAFCQSDDAEIASKHVPMPNTARFDPDLREAFREIIDDLPLKEAWADICDVDGVLPFSHDAYAKIHALSRPQLPVDVVYVDEAQDSNGLMIGLVDSQDAQRVWIGDSRQQIYSWRGSVDALSRVDVSERAVLTHSWRFGKEIADKANEVLELLGSNELLVGRGGPTACGVVANPTVVLCRTNAVAVKLALRELDRGGRPHVVRGADDVVSFARAAKDLQEGRDTTHPELACFDDWGDVRVYVMSDELGDDLRLLVELVDEFGAERIMSSFSRQPPEERASLVLSTAHGFKGREASKVRLADDFPDEEEDASTEELRLLYVACTRARSALDVTSVGVLDGPPTGSGK